MEIKKLELSEYSECVEESVKYAITPLYWPIYCFYKRTASKTVIRFYLILQKAYPL